MSQILEVKIPHREENEDALAFECPHPEWLDIAIKDEQINAVWNTEEKVYNYHLILWNKNDQVVTLEHGDSIRWIPNEDIIEYKKDGEEWDKKQYKVTCTETVCGTVWVTATSKEEAESLAEEHLNTHGMEDGDNSKVWDRTISTDEAEEIKDGE